MPGQGEETVEEPTGSEPDPLPVAGLTDGACPSSRRADRCDVLSFQASASGGSSPTRAWQELLACKRNEMLAPGVLRETSSGTRIHRSGAALPREFQYQLIPQVIRLHEQGVPGDRH